MQELIGKRIINCFDSYEEVAHNLYNTGVIEINRDIIQYVDFYSMGKDIVEGRKDEYIVINKQFEIKILQLSV